MAKGQSPSIKVGKEIPLTKSLIDLLSQSPTKAAGGKKIVIVYATSVINMRK